MPTGFFTLKHNPQNQHTGHGLHRCLQQVVDLVVGIQGNKSQRGDLSKLRSWRIVNDILGKGKLDCLVVHTLFL